MAIRNLYSAESWQASYRAFEQLSFTSYDFDSVKQAMLDYLKIYYKESFNDFIESSELIATVELFAYVAEMLAFRVDMMSHENFMATAERKDSILRLARLISYTASRNIPARGLVKLMSIGTTETLYDSQGNNLAGARIVWNDPNNPLWKEQFFLVINRCLSGKFGQPQKVKQIGDVNFQLYAFNNDLANLRNGVFPYTADTGSEVFPMEITPVDLDDNGPLERDPDPQSNLTLLYADDGLGDSSDLTGFLLFTKQGNLIRTEAEFAAQIPNQSYTINTPNLNETDVWVQKIDEKDAIIERWKQAEVVNAQNLFFSIDRSRQKFEIETLSDDRFRVIFGDGNFSDIPSGTFVIWSRQSINDSVVIQKNRVTNERMSFSYKSNLGLSENVSLTFSLTSSLQNAAASESIEHIRQTAPTTYYSQGRMVNGQDYNTLLLRDPTILRLKTVNRTFAGQPKYIDWNDASGNYENIKLFGNDAILGHNFLQNSITTSTSARKLVDEILEGLLSAPGVQNMVKHLYASYIPGVITQARTRFIEDTAIIPDSVDPTTRLQEKTRIQGLLDRHWYGEPSNFVSIGGVQHALVSNDTDNKIWQDTIPTTIDGVTQFSTGSGLQATADLPSFGLKFLVAFERQGNGTLSGLSATKNQSQTITIEMTTDPTIAYVTGSVTGAMKRAVVGELYATDVVTFTIVPGATDFIPGDAFIVDVTADITTPTVAERDMTSQTGFSSVNLNGEWKMIGGNLLDTTPTNFDPNSPAVPTANADSSWIIRIDRSSDDFGNNVGYVVTYRDLKLVVHSDTTKFWYNSSAQIIDRQTKNQVRDRVLVLRSNLVADGSKPLGTNDVYDVVGPVRDTAGVIDYHKLELAPADSTTNLTPDQDGSPARALQFEEFSVGNYTYGRTDGGAWVPTEVPPVTFNTGATTASDGSITYYRLQQRGTSADGLDFMWQHFSPFGNLIDPSPSNIHDMFVLTAGYYSSLRDYLEGRTNIVPTPPTPLELRNSYGALLNSKMLSDTVVMHPARTKLLFGSLAAPELRVKFRAVRNPNGSLTNDQIRAEILNVINSFFSIENWDFGVTFYATELIALIHQRLPLDLSSVVPVPLFANNSFGANFTIEAGDDEILQSAARLEDIEIVEYLSSSLLRQGTPT